MTLPTQFKKHVAGEDGWCDWETPAHDGYLMKCCDCGLVHEMQFLVLQQTTAHDAEGVYEAEPSADDTLHVALRARRHPETLAAPDTADVAGLLDDLLALRVSLPSGRVAVHPAAIRAVALIRSLVASECLP